MAPPQRLRGLPPPLVAAPILLLHIMHDCSHQILLLGWHIVTLRLMAGSRFNEKARLNSSLNDRPEAAAKYANSNLLGTFGVTHELRRVCAWLASDASSYCIGSACTCEQRPQGMAPVPSLEEQGSHDGVPMTSAGNFVGS
ncbi:hypothetical protein L226DRAFT_561806 [Lentinus tigrinus ALCF2SS1-7]|uniref:uncharacterized protein n=1 Tax=Lentinus tigrinus ALCF2SS1-7 TaxID=1328758 RepID=UPI001165FC26|nr:hypothetical protein L226DRAFT_561806 [Lentinus tigrinus ALCF2SS1-7]